MAKYSTILLKIKGKELIDFNTKSFSDQKSLTNGDVVYIYRRTKSKKVYIGQTKHFLERHKEHYNGTEEKFNNAHFDEVLVILSRYFNGSSLDDVESQLITYFCEDREKCSKPSVFHDDEVINRTGGNSVNDYEHREDVATDVVLPLWEDYLHPNGWVSIPTLKELREGALVKYSPIKMLTGDQRALISEIVNNPSKNYVINGDAGTGKTVLLTHLVAQILNQRKDAEIGIVVQPNWQKTGDKIFKIYGMNTTRIKVDTSTGIISSGKKYDVIIVDESHKLSRRGNKQMDSFNDAYDNPLYADCQSHCNFEVLDRDHSGNATLLPKFSNHSLRHTFTTRMCEAGVNIKAMQAILGHADAETTLDIYADATKELKRAELISFEEYFNAHKKAQQAE